MIGNRSTCPRCDDSKIDKLANSPVPGVWEVWRCNHCNFVWRTSEKLDDISKYDQEFVDRARNAWPV